MKITDTRSITRRDAVRLITSASLGAWIATRPLSGLALSSGDAAPPLAPGYPTSPERMRLIEDFKRNSAGLERKYEARTYKADWPMPYRLFHPEAKGKLPLVVYLHGSGG